MYQQAAEFSDEHGEHSQVDREREPADREARDGDTDPREPVAGMKSHHLQINAVRPVSASGSEAAGQGPPTVRCGRSSRS